MKTLKFALRLALAGILLAAAGCGKDDPTPGPDPAPQVTGPILQKLADRYWNTETYFLYRDAAGALCRSEYEIAVHEMDEYPRQIDGYEYSNMGIIYMLRDGSIRYYPKTEQSYYRYVYYGGYYRMSGDEERGVLRIDSDMEDLRMYQPLVGMDLSVVSVGDSEVLCRTGVKESLRGRFPNYFAEHDVVGLEVVLKERAAPIFGEHVAADGAVLVSDAEYAPDSERLDAFDPTVLTDEKFWQVEVCFLYEGDGPLSPLPVSDPLWSLEHEEMAVYAYPNAEEAQLTYDLERPMRFHAVGDTVDYYLDRSTSSDRLEYYDPTLLDWTYDAATRELSLTTEHTTLAERLSIANVPMRLVDYREPTGEILFKLPLKESVRTVWAPALAASGREPVGLVCIFRRDPTLTEMPTLVPDVIFTVWGRHAIYMNGKDITKL